jgi:hypothetical protein
MSNQLGNPKRPRDPSQLAKLVVDMATGEAARDEGPIEKDPAAVAMGRRGGAARASALTKSERQKIARKAAKARWGNKRR